MIKLISSVKLRLTLWYTVVLAIFLIAFAVFMHTELSRALYRDADQDLQSQVQEIQTALNQDFQKLDGALREDLAKGDHLPFSHTLKFREALKKRLERWELTSKVLHRNTLLIRLIHLDHQPILSNLKGWQRDIIFPDFERDSTFMEVGLSFQTIHFEDSPIRLCYYLIRYEGHPVLIIQSAKLMTEVRKTLDRLRLLLLVLVPIGITIAFGVGWLLALRSFRPVANMIQQARQVTSATSNERLPRTHAGDELDRLAETLNEMMDRIEASTRSLQDFSSDISHELKTPLAIIRGEIELALRRQRSPETLIETLHVIEGETNELIRLVDDLMILVRSDAQQLRLERKPMELRGHLQQVCARFLERSREKNIEIVTNLQAVGKILGDELYLKRLFGNLIDNAIKFSPAETVIRLDLVELGGYAVITIKDQGMGIESQDLEKIFSRFYRTDRARAFEGSGLGLNIAKAVCEFHEGEIFVSSLIEKGTLVTVRLPLL